MEKAPQLGKLRGLKAALEVWVFGGGTAAEKIGFLFGGWGFMPDTKTIHDASWHVESNFSFPGADRNRFCLLLSCSQACWRFEPPV